MSTRPHTNTAVVGFEAAKVPRVSHPRPTHEAEFFLGSHHGTRPWWSLGVPLFVSVRVVGRRRTIPSTAPWCLDSGGFTELRKHGRWLRTETEYLETISRLASLSPHLCWVAPQDYMCEDVILRRTGLTVTEHQRRTVASFLSIRSRLGDSGPLVIPILQGFTAAEYMECARMYAAEGIDLAAEPVVGLGSVCTRNSTREARDLVRYLSGFGWKLHGFGLKGDTFRACRHLLASADSMAWSYAARREGRDGNSPAEAMAWRERLLA